MRFDEINQALHKIGETTNQEVPLWCVRCGHKATRLNAYGCEGCNKQRDRETGLRRLLWPVKPTNSEGKFWHLGFSWGMFTAANITIIVRAVERWIANCAY